MHRAIFFPLQVVRIVRRQNLLNDVGGNPCDIHPFGNGLKLPLSDVDNLNRGVVNVD